MATAEELVAGLAARFPEDAEDLGAALEVLRRERLGSCERLARLGDSQWQRLGLPLGIETLLRDSVTGLAAAAAAAAPSPRPVAAAAEVVARVAEDDDGGAGELPLEEYERPAGLHQRRGFVGSAPGQAQGLAAAEARTLAGSGGRGGAAPNRERRRRPLPEEELVPPVDLEEMWQRLLEDTLTPDKRAALQASWEATPNEHDRYMMFLEYTSYLRRPEVSEEEQAERRKQLEPLLRELGICAEEGESGWQGATVWWLCASLAFLFAGLVYYSFSQYGEPAHDLEGL